MDEETSNLENCCEDKIYSKALLQDTNSEKSIYRFSDKNGVSALSTINGTLCWDQLMGSPTFPKSYVIKFKDSENNEIDHIMSLDISYLVGGESDNNGVFTFISENDGKCYEGDISVEEPFFVETGATSEQPTEDIIYEDEESTQVSYEIGQSVEEKCLKGIIFDGIRGGYANVNYKEYPQELTFGVYFFISGHENVANNDADKSEQFIVFQENERDDNKNGAFYAKYIAETENSGKLVVGVQKNDGESFFVETESNAIKVNFRYMLHVVIGDEHITMYLDGNKIATTNKTSGIDYYIENTLHLGRKRAIQNQDDSFMQGEIHSFYLYGKSFSDEFIQNLNHQLRVSAE